MRGTGGPYRYRTLCHCIATIAAHRLYGAHLEVTLGNKRFVFVVSDVYPSADTKRFSIGWGVAGSRPQRRMDGRSRVSKSMTECSIDQVMEDLQWMCLGGRWLKGRVVKCTMAEARPIRGCIRLSDSVRRFF